MRLHAEALVKIALEARQLVAILLFYHFVLLLELQQYFLLHLQQALTCILRINLKQVLSKEILIVKDTHR